MERAYKGGINAYWKRRGYYRLDAAAAQRRRRPLPTAELGGVSVRRRRGWRVRRGVLALGGRLLRALSPRRWLARLRDAYVSAMLRMASSPAVGFGAGAPYCACPEAFPRPPPHLNEYDEKVPVEIYRSILARGGQIAVVGEGTPAAATLRLSAAV
ncbi:uncharacterized protein LOC100829476 [Brachypodium distachyon]|uniref:Uncharacterized protein n=1 Tax=Brachypodium distachyon TaxID=15368 RepID=I1HEW6_BRADI|nr:uncharacterized protein LOC100829476 [Brachypodium distachyon]KQK04111.1 hypothetical protein BRADI_2g11750v3 [Brachypodium distachyon]|eukprot:XP_010230831.1 uncharacterized protein LOC100829476 [Brachypodium distachyon]